MSALMPPESPGETGARHFRHLSPRSVEILRAVVAAIRPRGHGFDQPIDEDVLLEIDRTVPYAPAPLRMTLPLGLRALEWTPLLWGAGATRLTVMRREEALPYLERWLGSRIAPCRVLLLGIRALTFLAFYQHPAVLASMGVDWQGRIAPATRRRAETLERDHAPPD